MNIDRQITSKIWYFTESKKRNNISKMYFRRTNYQINSIKYLEHMRKIISLKKLKKISGKLYKLSGNEVKKCFDRFNKANESIDLTII